MSDTESHRGWGSGAEDRGVPFGTPGAPRAGREGENPDPVPESSNFGRYFTPKSTLVAALGVLALAYWMPTWVLFRASKGNGGGYLPLFALGTLILLVPLATILRRVGIIFSAGEKLFIFSALAVALFSFRTSAFIVTLLPSPYNFATTENNFEGEFLHAVPSHLVPFNDTQDERLSWFYRGLPEKIPEEAEQDWSLVADELPRESIPWRLWTGPLAWWLSLFAAVWIAQFCLAAILRKQWLEHETLMVPQADVVLTLVEKERPSAVWPRIFSSRAFWIGVGISLAIFALEGLHTYFPAVPNLKLRALTLKPYLTEPPWDAMVPQLTIEPYLVGIAYLLPAQLSLSLWFFAVVDNLTRVFLVATGQEPTVRVAWAGGVNGGSDAVGAVTVFTLVLLWGARRHLWAVVRKALWNDPSVDDSEEFLSHRVAFFGLLASLGFIIFWALHAGMSLLVTLFLFGFFFIIVIFISRVVCECGLVTARLYYLLPYERLVHLIGYKPWMLGTFAVNSFIWPTLMIEMQPLPLYLTAARVTQGYGGKGTGRRRWRPMWFVFLLLLLVAAVVVALRTVQVSYLRGGLNGSGGFYNETIWVFNNRLVRDVILKERAHSLDSAHVTAMVGGGLIMALLLLMRQLFYWWPFHPIGYVAAGLGGGIWFCFFIGWLIKRFVLKYGGGALFHQATPVFVGLVAGQFFSGVVWFVVGTVHGELSFAGV